MTMSLRPTPPVPPARSSPSSFFLFPQLLPSLFLFPPPSLQWPCHAHLLQSAAGGEVEVKAWSKGIPGRHRRRPSARPTTAGRARSGRRRPSSRGPCSSSGGGLARGEAVWLRGARRAVASAVGPLPGQGPCRPSRGRETGRGRPRGRSTDGTLYLGTFVTWPSLSSLLAWSNTGRSSSTIRWMDGSW